MVKRKDSNHLNHLDNLGEEALRRAHLPEPKYLPLRDFCLLGYMQPQTFYNRVQAGIKIPGARKLGSRWFVNLREYESSLGEAA